MKIDPQTRFDNAAHVAQAPVPIPVHDISALVGNGNLAHIQLNQQTYTLRITRQGKLILTK